MGLLSTEYTDAFITYDRLKSVETSPSSDAFFYLSVKVDVS